MDHGRPADGPENLEFSSFLFWRNHLPNTDRDLQDYLIDRRGKEEEENEFEDSDDPQQHQADPAGISASSAVTLLQKTNVFAPDYIAGVSPFAENDISSRSVTLQVQDGTLRLRCLNSGASRKMFVKKR
ncbi:hypothetical protein U0070_012398 [Myodes glareolus]|uniref:Putative WW-binding domain-containing protein n=1 Tax=Myodes glareolus TaxID=447135 RepID=A0AAW0IDS6_MYOGA